MTNNDDMALKARADFERWWEVNYHNGNQPRFGWQAWRDGDGYKTDEDDSELNDLWNVWQAAQSSLLEERDWQAKRIEMLEKYVNDRDEENQGLLLTVGRLHTKLEARTVSIKLPPASLAELNDSVEPVWTTRSVIAACEADGIKLEVDGR